MAAGGSRRLAEGPPQQHKGGPFIAGLLGGVESHGLLNKRRLLLGVQCVTPARPLTSLSRTRLQKATGPLAN